MPYTKICEYEECGKEFIAPNRKQKCCSKRCARLRYLSDPENFKRAMVVSHTEETNRKRSLALQGTTKNFSPEGLAILQEKWAAQVGVPFSEERKRKISEGCKKAWEDPELRRSHSERRKQYCQTPEGKEQVRKAGINGCLAQLEQNGYTSLEIALYDALDQLGLEYISQLPMYDKFIVDAYLPEYDLVIESNGTYWHADPRVYVRGGGQNRGKIAMNRAQQLRIAQDAAKKKYLKEQGHNLLVLWEEDKENFMDIISKRVGL